MGFHKVNLEMQECLSCIDEYTNSYELIESLFAGIKGLNDIFLSDLLESIASVIEEIYNDYVNLGLLTEDEEPYDEDSFKITKIERNLADRKIRSYESIPENMKPYFPSDEKETSDPSEFEVYIAGLIDSDSAWGNIKDGREFLDEAIQIIGDEPFERLLCDVDDNAYTLAENLDRLYADFINKAKRVAYFF
ncbi:MAG: hypothetical protein Q7U57_04525 [Methylovulum sp.]|nr:hypothetical protein [Methylovulum sp.]